MSIALVEQLNFEKQMPISGGSMQEIAIALPVTGSTDYYGGNYCLINIPRCGPHHIFDPANSFLCFCVTNLDDKIFTPDHSADRYIHIYIYISVV